MKAHAAGTDCARLRRDAGRHLVPGRAAQLRRAPRRRRRQSGSDRDRRPLPDARTGRALLRRAARPGRARAGRAPAARRRPGRPCRRVHAEHPRDAGGVRGDGEHRGCLCELRAGARRPQRRRPARAARAGGAAGGRRLRLPRPLDRPPRRGGDDPRRPPHPAPRRARPVRRPCTFGCALLGRVARRARAARIRAGRLRPPAVRVVLVGDDGPAEGDRPRARRHPARVPQGALLQLGPEAGRPPALVPRPRG